MKQNQGSMAKVTVLNQQLQLGKKSLPLITGEVHYWRLNPGYWKQVLEQVRVMGLNTISTYVPWHYHEFERGQFDFTGRSNPSRNLVEFLKLCRELKFYVVLRPGPYIYSEWPNDGVPDYAYQYHKLHPQFLKYAEIYLKAVSHAVRPFLATQGGPVVLVQADNEIDPWPDRFGNQYGLSGKPGMFQSFLEELYRGDLHLLNQSWGTDYGSFEEAGPFIATMLASEKGLPLKGDHELRRNLDYFKFKHDYSNRYADWMIRAYRRLGFDVPIYLNLYPFFYAHDWAQFQELADFVGLDLYPTNEFHEDAFEHRKMIDKIRYLSQISKLPFIAEFESGIWHERQVDTGTFSANHYRLLVMSAILAGAAGWNWYMLVNRDNWYMSPINEWGRPRHGLFEVFQRIVQVYQRIQPALMKKICPIAVTFHPLQYAAKAVPHENPLLTALYEGDIDYDVVDIRSRNFKQPFLIYSGSQWLDEGSQRNLKSYVERGGTLIAFRDFPRKDENFKTSSILGFEDPRSTLFEFKKALSLRFDADHEVNLVSSVYTFEARGAQKISVHVPAYGTLTIGYIKKLGKGKIVHLGLEPSTELLSTLFSYLRVPLPSQARTKDIQTALFSKGKTFYLVAVNNGVQNRGVLTDVPHLGKGKWKAVDLFSGKALLVTKDKQKLLLTFDLPRKDGTIIELRRA